MNLAGKKILVTGGAGFIGVHVIKAIRDGGGQAYSLARSPGQGGFSCDLRDENQVRTTLTDHYDVVVHLASVSRREPDAGDIDLLMTRNLVAHVRCDQMVFLSTADEYDGRGMIRVDESIPINPINRYGADKKRIREYLEQSCRSRGIGLTVLRPFSVYGTGLPEYMFLSLVIDAIRQVRPFMFSALPKVRDFLHVDDLTRAICHCLASVPRNELATFNVGTGIATALTDLVSMVLEQTGSQIATDRSSDIGGNDPDYLVADSSALFAETGWSASIVLPDGLNRLLLETGVKS